MATAKVVSWIRKMIAHEGDGDGGAVAKLVLRHQTPSAVIGADVHTVRLPRKLEGGDEQVVGWAEELERAAQDDAEGLQGATQSYIVFAYSLVDREMRRPVSRCPIRISSADLADAGDGRGLQRGYAADGEMDSEPPTMRGFVTQLMRHTEGATKTMVMGSQHMIASLTRENANLRELVEKLVEKSMSRDMDIIKLTEDMYSQRHEREIATATAVKQEERKGEAFGKIMMLFPNIVNRITGKKLLPESTTPLTEMVDQLASSIKDAQVEKLAAVFDGDQQMLLFSIIQATKSKQAAEQAAKESEAAARAAKEKELLAGRGTNGTTMPSADAGGGAK